MTIHPTKKEREVIGKIQNHEPVSAVELAAMNRTTYNAAREMLDGATPACKVAHSVDEFMNSKGPDSKRYTISIDTNYYAFDGKEKYTGFNCLMSELEKLD